MDKFSDNLRYKKNVYSLDLSEKTQRTIIALKFFATFLVYSSFFSVLDLPSKIQGNV